MIRLPSKNRLKGYLWAYTMALVAVCLTICMVRFPEVAFQAAVHGLKVWFEIVFPALLPFFIGSEILMGLGVVHFMGVLLEPFMRPLFNIPGVGSFVMAMGLASGYPIGAVLTARLRKQKLCTRVEAERLMSFTNTADPLFMIGAVAVGMFGIVQLGVVLTIAHYIGALLVGLVLRFYAANDRERIPQDSIQGNVFVRALKALYRARVEDARPFGRLLGDAIKQSVNTLLVVGGFIILFSVLIQMATTVGFTAFMAKAFGRLLTLFGLSEGLASSLVSGFFEITIGSDLVARAADASGTVLPLLQRTVVASAIIAWSGLSVHFQVAAMINETDIRMTPYVAARALHAVFSALAAYFLMPHLMKASAPFATITVPVFSPGTLTAATSFWRWRLLHLGIYPLLLLLILGLVHATFTTLRAASITTFFFRR
ncbi:MAG: sporulation integral membrane protein YlbJ [Firmicutes bacterium]|jgi:sporulation integral membrane protein YlbJ|nr:sporulation integral membrane protein YlbJ [Bacillota bacterium]